MNVSSDLKNIFLKSNLFKENTKKKYNYNNKINGINAILWLNLDISVDRRKYMEKILNKINIKNIRIKSVDGVNFDIKNTYIDYENSKKINFAETLINSELATTLSHFKAFNFIKNLDGDFFLICEDDVCFKNVKYFKNLDLNKIIKESPKFDILTLYKTKINKLNDLYTEVNEFNKDEKKDHIWGAVAYIITKKYANKLSQIISYNKENNKFTINTEKPISQSDIFIFSFGKAYVYKYNFISTKINKSLIHSFNKNNHKLLHEKSNKNQLKYILKDFYLK